MISAFFDYVDLRKAGFDHGYNVIIVTFKQQRHLCPGDVLREITQGARRMTDVPNITRGPAGAQQNVFGRMRSR